MSQSRRRSQSRPGHDGSRQEPVAPDAGAVPNQAHAERVAATRMGPDGRATHGGKRQASPAPIERDDTPMLDGDALMEELAHLSPDEFARLLDHGSPSMPDPGDQVTGRIVRITRDSVFVDVGAKAEGIMERASFDKLPEIGSEITAYVLHSGDRGVRLASRLSGRAAMDAIVQAKETGIPVEGRVSGRNPGGFTVRLGDADAFCPVSQIDRIVAGDLDTYVGRNLSFRVLEIRDRDIVVSHRVIAEEEAEAMAQQTWNELDVGQVREGIVTGRKEFGVFVDIDGVRGLVPRREIGWADDVVPPNQGAVVSVRVLAVDREAGRVTLSLRDPDLSPWARIGKDILVGDVARGTVTRLETYGAFVRIDAGIEGLVHISNMSEGRVDHPGALVKVGQEIDVRILSADRDRERLELGMKQAGEGWELEQDRPQDPRKDTGSLGTFADLFANVKIEK